MLGRASGWNRVMQGVRAVRVLPCLETEIATWKPTMFMEKARKSQSTSLWIHTIDIDRAPSENGFSSMR
jgi:hypothetical protein